MTVDKITPEDSEMAVIRLYLGNGKYNMNDAAFVVSSTDVIISEKESENSKLPENERKPVILKTSTDQWPYITYLKADSYCRITNETFAGQIDTKPTARLRIMPDGELSDYVDCKAGDVVQIVPFDPKATPNDSGPKPVIYVIIPCK